MVNGSVGGRIVFSFSGESVFRQLFGPGTGLIFWNISRRFPSQPFAYTLSGPVFTTGLLKGGLTDSGTPPHSGWGDSLNIPRFPGFLPFRKTRMAGMLRVCVCRTGRATPEWRFGRSRRRLKMRFRFSGGRGRRTTGAKGVRDCRRPMLRSAPLYFFRTDSLREESVLFVFSGGQFRPV